MTLRDIERELGLQILTSGLESKLNQEVPHGHASDLLSDVLAHAKPGSVLITIQVNMNVIAVSVHAGLIAVIFSSGRRPDETVIQKAIEEGIVLYASSGRAFDLAGRLYEMGLRG